MGRIILACAVAVVLSGCGLIGIGVVALAELPAIDRTVVIPPSFDPIRTSGRWTAEEGVLEIDGENFTVRSHCGVLTGRLLATAETGPDQTIRYPLVEVVQNRFERHDLRPEVPCRHRRITEALGMVEVASWRLDGRNGTRISVLDDESRLHGNAPFVELRFNR